MINEEISVIKNDDPLTRKIIACAYKVHSDLGPGFSEKIYHNALKVAMDKIGLRYDTEKEFKVIFEDKQVGTLRVDLYVEEKIIVEVKAVTGRLPKLFESQVVSYLKIAQREAGLLLNFGNKSCQVRRLMNNHCNLLLNLGNQVHSKSL